MSNDLSVDADQIQTFFEHINHKDLNHKFQVFKKDNSATTQLNVSTPTRLIKLCEKHNLMGLSCISVNPRSKTKTKTASVTAITNILIDVDVRKDRKKNGVSTAEDKTKAKETAQAIIKELETKINLRTSLFIDSGNGFHIYIPVDGSLKDFFKGKNDDENKGLWDQSDRKGKLARLEQKLNKFNNEICEIDCISKDIVRRVKIPGTWNIKPGIQEKDYRIAKIITVHGEAITDPYVKGNTKVFNSFKPLIDEDAEQVYESEIPVDDAVDLHEILTQDVKAKRLFDGNWEKHYDYKSRSEAELGLAIILLSKGLPEDRVRNALKNAKIGKWKSANKGYKDLTIKRAKVFLQKHPDLVEYQLFKFIFENKVYQLKIKQENTGDVFYSVVINGKDGLETKVSPDFLHDNRKRNDFFKNVFLELGVDEQTKKQELKQVLLDVIKEIQHSGYIHTQQQISQRNREQEKQGKQKQQQENYKENKIHGAGGIFYDLVIEPVGDYRYIYNLDGKKGIARAVLDPETRIWDIEIENRKFVFKTKPLDDIPFKIPRESVINQYLKGEYQLKTSQELYENVVSYLKVLYDVPGDFFYHIIAVGTLQSWIVDLLQVVFYLCFSARFGAGKTAFLEGLAIISRHGFLAGNISSSTVARATNTKKLTLFGDELDVKGKSKDNETFLTYRQGYKRNNPYMRQKETSDGYVDEIIDVFGFKGYSIHSRAEDALASRSVEIPLRISNDTTLPILNMFKDRLGTPLFEDLFFWYIEHGSMINTNMMETKETKNSHKETESLPLAPLFPLFPNFLRGEEDVCVHTFRKKLFDQFTSFLSTEELEVLQKFFGRNEELLFVALYVCKVFGIEQLGSIESTFKQKVQNEGDANVFIQMLRDYLKDIYEENSYDKECFLKGGDYDGYFYYEKAKVYRGFRKKLKDEDFKPVGQDKFEAYLMALNFNKGLNIKKENFKIDDKRKGRLALIYDEDVLSALNIDKKQDIEDFGKTHKIPDQKKDLQDFTKFVLMNKLDGNNILKDSFSWDDDVNDFIKNELGKKDPDYWINKLIEIGILEEPLLGNLQFLIIPKFSMEDIQ